MTFFKFSIQQMYIGVNYVEDTGPGAMQTSKEVSMIHSFSPKVLQSGEETSKEVKLSK